MRTYKFNNPHFETNNKLVYQKYSLFESVNFIKKNYKNLLVIIDKNFYKNSKYILRFIKILKKNKIKITLFLYDYNFEPSYDYVDKITSELKTKIKRFDCIFSCGGGSALDFSKALAITLKNKKKSRFFRGFFEKINAFPIISAPTTVSTGSEASYFAPIIDENISVFDIQHINRKTFSFNNLTDPIIVKPGFKKTIPGLGMKRENATGNLIVEFNIIFPDKLTEEQRNTIEKLL
jgi:alcohol dehydrogenase class IV